MSKRSGRTRATESEVIKADNYVPSRILRHRYVENKNTRGDRQLQFLVQWEDGWTTRPEFARKVIRQNKIDPNLYYVEYKNTREPYTNHAIASLAIEYANNAGKKYGSPFDEYFEKVVAGHGTSDDDSDMPDVYTFQYNDQPEDSPPEIPPLKKRRGRPTKKTKTQAPKRQNVKERSILCGCRLQCRAQFTQTERKTIRSEYDALTALQARSTWLTNLITLTPVPIGTIGMVLRPYKGRAPKKYTATYHFIKHHTHIHVCKRFFQAVLAVGNSMLKNLNDHNFTIQSGGHQLMTRTDKRGKHQPKHAATQEQMQRVHEHITSFPRQRSHYTKSKRETLDSSLNVTKMHEMYREREECTNRRVLGIATYRKVFNTYDLSFASLKADSCGTCDKYKAILDAEPNNHEIKKKWDAHKTEAEIAFQMQSYDREIAGQDGVESIWCDMMSVQNIPRLGTNAAFYKRKYSVYVEGFYLASNQQHTMQVWGEMNGMKKPLSALHKFIRNTVPDCKHLVIWCDGTSSQLKNVNTLLYMLHITDPDSPLYMFERLTLRYAPPGHTYMSPGPDQSFGQISRHLKKRKVIGDPLEIVELINECTNITAESHFRDEHIDWTSYLGQYYKTNRNFLRFAGEAMLMKARWFSFGYSEMKDNNRTIMVRHRKREIRLRTSFEQKDWKSFIVDGVKTRRPKAHTHPDFAAYQEALPIGNAKIHDLRSLKQFLPRKYHNVEIYNLSSEDESE